MTTAPVPHIGSFKKHLRNLFIMRSLTVILLVSIILSFGYVVLTANLEKQANAGNLSVDNILGLINLERKKANLAALQPDTNIALAAENKARDMGLKSYFNHYSPEGKRGLTFMQDAKIKYQIAAENLAVLFSDSQELVDSWMNSASHRKNILKPEFALTGIGLYAAQFEGYQTTFVVQFFTDIDTPKKSTLPILTNNSSLAQSTPKVETPPPPKELTQAEKEEIAKQEQQKTFNSNLEKTKALVLADLRLAVNQLFKK